MREQHVVDLLQREGPLSRADIARRCGISKPTASLLVGRLLRSGLLREEGTVHEGPGRPGRLVSLDPRAGTVVALDVGGTTTRAVLSDLSGRSLATVRTRTPASDAGATADHVASVVAELSTMHPTAGPLVHVALGTPGVVDEVERRIRYAPNLPALETPGFLDHLRDAVPAPLTVLNDVKAATLGELRSGAGVAVDDLVYAGIGTGLGFGLVVGREVYEGVGGRAGEFGLAPYPAFGSTLEDRVSGSAIRTLHLAAGGSGRPEDAFAEAESGRDPGRSIVEGFVHDLAWTVAVLTSLLDPQRVVLGGGIGLRCAPYLEVVTQRVSHACGYAPDLAVTELGDDAGLIGAASVALDAARTVQNWMEGGRLEATR